MKSRHRVRIEYEGCGANLRNGLSTLPTCRQPQGIWGSHSLVVQMSWSARKVATASALLTEPVQKFIMIDFNVGAAEGGISRNRKLGTIANQTQTP